LPIFGVFLESVYKDKQLGYTQGKFPESTVEITKSYKCETPRYSEPEPEQSDSTNIDEQTDEGLIGPEEESTEGATEHNNNGGSVSENTGALEQTSST